MVEVIFQEAASPLRTDHSSYSPRGANVHLMHGSRVHTILPPKRHLSRVILFCRAHGHGQQTDTNRLRGRHTTLRPDICDNRPRLTIAAAILPNIKNKNNAEMSS